VVTWIAAGQSIYRLLVPSLLLMVLVGMFNVAVQELVLPRANQTQDALRAALRSRGEAPTVGSRSWSATGNRIYSFDTPPAGGGRRKEVSGLNVFEFNENGFLSAVYRSANGVWTGDALMVSGSAERIKLTADGVVRDTVENPVLEEPRHPFSYANQRPSHLNTLDTMAYLREVDSEIEARNMAVALQEKYTTAILPLLIVLFTAPFGLSLGRKGKVVTVAYAVGVWLVYMGVGNMFEQFGLSGAITPATAVWLPLVGFASAGVVLLSRVRT
jgi:lipopolysaccharide export LptBFGC system permease protein LptF